MTFQFGPRGEPGYYLTADGPRIRRHPAQQYHVAPNSSGGNLAQSIVRQVAEVSHQVTVLTTRLESTGVLPAAETTQRDVATDDSESHRNDADPDWSAAAGPTSRARGIAWAAVCLAFRVCCYQPWGGLAQ